MPYQPTWFHRLEEIRSELRSLPADYLDRQAVEKLFRIGSRRARQLMAGLPYLQVGNAVAVDRQALLERLANTGKTERFQWELSRRTRVAESLEILRQHAATRQIRIPAATNVHNHILGDLPQWIELRPGELRIEFCDAEDLAAKLFELSQAMANDWEALTKIVEPNFIAAGLDLTS